MLKDSIGETKPKVSEESVKVFISKPRFLSEMPGRLSEFGYTLLLRANGTAAAFGAKLFQAKALEWLREMH